MGAQLDIRFLLASLQKLDIGTERNSTAQYVNCMDGPDNSGCKQIACGVLVTTQHHNDLKTVQVKHGPISRQPRSLQLKGLQSLTASGQLSSISSLTKAWQEIISYLVEASCIAPSQQCCQDHARQWQQMQQNKCNCAWAA